MNISIFLNEIGYLFLFLLRALNFNRKMEASEYRHFLHCCKSFFLKLFLPLDVIINIIQSQPWHMYLIWLILPVAYVLLVHFVLLVRSIVQGERLIEFKNLSILEGIKWKHAALVAIVLVVIVGLNMYNQQQAERRHQENLPDCAKWETRYSSNWGEYRKCVRYNR